MQRGLQRLIGTLILIFVVFALTHAFTVFRRMNGAENTLSELRETANLLRQENERLQFGIENACEDETLSTVARDRLGLVLPEDRVFIEFGN